LAKNEMTTITNDATTNLPIAFASQDQFLVNQRGHHGARDGR
jgi:hypothetical protein